VSAFGSISSLELQRIWDGVHGRVVHGDRITLGVIELDPGSVIPEHSHENEQLGICLSGSLWFRVGDESRDLGPGESWVIPSNVPHEVRVGPDGAVVVDVFAPVREDWRATSAAEPRAPRWPEG
jgi:quercetin dioxygenase-like cupin family protein